ncbi:IS3 family transposase, partial [Methylobacterium sp. J-048]|nr:IS3 family transposase [Methylobacterium sp. J-048]
MKRGQRPRAELVVLMLRQIEVHTAQGKSIAVACKEGDGHEQSHYRCQKEYVGLKVDQSKKM